MMHLCTFSLQSLFPITPLFVYIFSGSIPAADAIKLFKGELFPNGGLHSSLFLMRLSYINIFATRGNCMLITIFFVFFLLPFTSSTLTFYSVSSCYSTEIFIHFCCFSDSVYHSLCFLLLSYSNQHFFLLLNRVSIANV